MIFVRAAQREFAQTAASVLVVLLAVLFTTTLIRLLKQAAGGKVPSESVLALLGFNSIEFLPIVLSLTLFVSILLCVSRAYRDSEMPVWFSAGLPLLAWMRPMFRFALPVTAVVCLLSLLLTPWALSKRAEFREQIDRRDDASRVVTGTFNESRGGERVFFVESVDEQGGVGGVKNVFVSSMQHGRLGVVAARHGRVEFAENGDKFIVLTDGRRYEATAGSAEYRVMTFSRYAIRAEVADTQAAESPPRLLSTWELARNPSPPNLAELAWRIGLPVSALMLALLAIPLAYVNPRAGRTGNLLLAILVFMTYNNLLSVNQAWIAQGRLSFSIGVWAVHLPALLIAILLFWKRQSVATWRRFIS